MAEWAIDCDVECEPIQRDRLPAVVAKFAGSGDALRGPRSFSP